GVSPSSSIMGTATSPSTILSRKLISMKTASRKVIVQGRPTPDTSLITLPFKDCTAKPVQAGRPIGGLTGAVQDLVLIAPCKIRPSGCDTGRDYHWRNP